MSASGVDQRRVRDFLVPVVAQALVSGLHVRHDPVQELLDLAAVVLEVATHAQVVAALAAEKIDWLACEVKHRMKDGTVRVRSGLTLAEATKLQAKLLADGCPQVEVTRSIVTAGWPQLSAEQLASMDLPPTPLEELRKIRDPILRKAALGARRAADDVKAKEMQAAEAE